MKKQDPIKKVTGYGVVGTWFAPRNKLGGVLPQWLSSEIRNAISESDGNLRLHKFLKDGDQYLCKITIEPIKKLKKKVVLTDE